MTWDIGGLQVGYVLTILRDNQEPVPQEPTVITMLPGELSMLQASMIVGTIVFFSLPGPFMYWYWKSRHSEEYHEVL
jgi:hypothetical protein